MKKKKKRWMVTLMNFLKQFPDSYIQMDRTMAMNGLRERNNSDTDDYWRYCHDDAVAVVVADDGYYSGKIDAAKAV